MKNISFCNINDTLNNYHILSKNKDTCIINLTQSLPYLKILHNTQNNY